MRAVECIRKHKNNSRKGGTRPAHQAPDTYQPEFVRECKRQSGLLRDDPQELEVLRFLDEAACRDGWVP
ncbi:MAG: antitoxin MazE family protein [Magnetococcales bacterium]|nr:antitoxin MazE family protein [Magnetococcales bacterium]